MATCSAALAPAGWHAWGPPAAQPQHQHTSQPTWIAALPRTHRSHRRHTSRFIIIYLTFLPFALWPYLEWVMLPTMLVRRQPSSRARARG